MVLMPSIAAVVATHNRPELLANRSLASIASQTRLPDYLIVVDDSDLDARRTNAEIVGYLSILGTQKFYMENQRTAGASGAWNTALSHLQDIDPSVYVAFLDDDDSWAPTYLSQCEEAVLESRLDMAAAGLVFHHSKGLDGYLLDPPSRLNVSDLLVLNPHIQASNMFVRLRKLLEAGGFDEALTSTTDRDLCIRLTDLGTVDYGPLNEHLVHHYAENDRPRLSAPGGDSKRAGLSYFYRKYRGRMSDEQQVAFIERSQRLFACDPSEPTPVPPTASHVSADGSAEGPLVVVVGTITSPNTHLVSRLFDSLVERFGGHKDVTLKVVVLENGGHDASCRDALREKVTQASQRGLEIVVKTLEQQAVDTAAGVFAATQDQLSRQKSIALSRTMLQHYLFLEAKPLQGAVVWILDDDLVLEGLSYGPSRSLHPQDIDYVSGIRRLKETGADVVLCEVTGDPPVPFLSCIRTQLIDLYHNLHRLAVLSPDAPFPNLRDENRLARLHNPDYYYDLSSRGTSHLELPFWYEAERGNLTAGEVFWEITARLPGILSGVQVFRPLVRGAAGEVDSNLSPSVNRGPATLVFDLQALREFPNAVPTVDGAAIRRSDMVWSLLNHFAGGRAVVQAPMPVRQVRGVVPRSEPDFATMERDIHGYALYSSLKDLLRQKAQVRQDEGMLPWGRDLLEFGDSEIELAISLYRRSLHERAVAFELSYIRIMGVVSAIRRLCQDDPSETQGPWWLKAEEYSAAAAKLRSFVDSLASAYLDAHLNDFKQRIAETDVTAIENFLRSLPKTVERHRANTPLPLADLQRAAEAYVRAEFETGPLNSLGVGEEGVVLTDGRLVYKYFHYWKARDREHRVEFLQSLAGRLHGYRTLPDLVEVRRRGDHVVAVYPYEKGTGFEGGYLEGLLTLLRETRQAGIACRNIHPDNLLVTSSGLKLIDYGSDIVPVSADESKQMYRRVFLTYRFPFRSDLKRLMTKALTDASLPELTGLDLFLRALNPRGLDELYYRPMADLVSSEGPGAVLDYGCGGGRLTEELSRQGIRAIGYDPDPVSIALRLKHGNLATYGGRELLDQLLAEDTRFDAVVCGRVLCTIADDREFQAVVRDLRRFVADSGTALVAVCNPFHLSSASTELGEKHLPASSRYEDTFVYEKTVAINGNRRRDVHRSYSTYRRTFAKAGFRIEEVSEFDGVDTNSLLPASDHLAFRLTPARTEAPRVSLLIKTCLMEWRMIERMVRHQVGQLESPVQFAEKVVVVDTLEGPFARQYDLPDPGGHRAAMEHLLEDGVVDRVVYAPTEPEVIRSTYRIWFGSESAESHSVNGQPLFATLFGFESCTGDYVLQLDSDLLIARGDSSHDYLSEMVEVLRRDPKALFVPMSIWRPEPAPYSHEGPDGDWRVEVRGCMFDWQRLQSVLPVSNEREQGRFALGWHRAFDHFVAATDYRSYRGGDPKTAFIHVPNDRKADQEEWLDVIGSAERGHVPAIQLERVELTGSISDWAGPKRYEPFVLVICARNVEPGRFKRCRAQPLFTNPVRIRVIGRFKRCFESLIAQRGVDWGAVVVDDASANGFGDYAHMLFEDYAPQSRVTVWSL